MKKKAKNEKKKKTRKLALLVSCTNMKMKPEIAPYNHFVPEPKTMHREPK